MDEELHIEERAADQVVSSRLQATVDANGVRMDRIERAVFGYKDEGGAFVVGILGSMKDMNDALYGGWDEKHKTRIPGILELATKQQLFQEGIGKAANKMVYGLGMIIVIGLFNALHLSGEWIKVAAGLFGH